MEGYSRIIYKIMSTGTQVSPDMLQPDAFPDWGPEVKDVSDNLDTLAPGPSSRRRSTPLRPVGTSTRRPCSSSI